MEIKPDGPGFARGGKEGRLSLSFEFEIIHQKPSSAKARWLVVVNSESAIWR